VCFICGTLPTGTLIVCIPNLFFFFPPKERHNVGLLRFDDDHDHICYRLRRFKYLAEKVMSSNHYNIKVIILCTSDTSLQVVNSAYNNTRPLVSFARYRFALRLLPTQSYWHLCVLWLAAWGQISSERAA
jgi:hypothetical protein